MRERLSTLFWRPLEAFQADDENCSTPHTDTVFLRWAHAWNTDPLDLGLVVSVTRNGTSRTFQWTLWLFNICHRTKLKANYFQIQPTLAAALVC